MSAAMNPGQILLPRYGMSSSQRRHQSSCSWTGKISSSKYTGSSLAFAWGLHWWQAAAVHVDLQATMRQQRLGRLDSWLDLFPQLQMWGMENPKGSGLYL
jgi:hypothetical protein